MQRFKDRAAWLEGSAVPCESLRAPPLRIHRLVLIGAPGVGKGTQADLLCQRLGTCHLSTGDLFRAAQTLTDGELSPELLKAMASMKRGELISDQTVLEMVRQRSSCLRCPIGFVLDGFPRTVDQAEALHKILEDNCAPLNAAINYVSPLDSIITRLSGRRVCPKCNATFHVATRPPLAKGICDHCGATLCQREDDQPKSIQIRMQAYEQNARALLDYYRTHELLINVNADGPPELVCEQTIAILL